MLFDTEQWRRLVPQSPLVLLQAWNTWVHYATFHLPPEFNGFYGYNALQQIAYFSVVFVFGPLAILTGIAMSPAVVNRFPRYAKLFGGRQSARSLHFLTMLGFFGFIVVHVTLIVMTGFVRNMNHIVMGTDDPHNRLGMILGFVGIGVVMLTWVGRTTSPGSGRGSCSMFRNPSPIPLSLMTLNRLTPSQHYTEKDISPRFWPNGMMPGREDWKQLAKGGFQDYRLKVGGLVDNPVELSLADIAKLGVAENITMHHCIQGWTGIAKWGGLPMKSLVELVRPKPNAKVVAFFSFGDSLYGVGYYDTQSLENVLQAGCLLATEMNGEPLTEVYGAPLAAAG